MQWRCTVWGDCGDQDDRFQVRLVSPACCRVGFSSFSRILLCLITVDGILLIVPSLWRTNECFVDLLKQHEVSSCVPLQPAWAKMIVIVTNRTILYCQLSFTTQQKNIALTMWPFWDTLILPMSGSQQPHWTTGLPFVNESQISEKRVSPEVSQKLWSWSSGLSSRSGSPPLSWKEQTETWVSPFSFTKGANQGKHSSHL